MDLTDPANSRKSEDARFIERVFKSAEADLITSAPDPNQALWSLWACKEAAYKALSKAVSKRSISSSPLKYSVSLDLSTPCNFIKKGRIRMLNGSVSAPSGRVPVRLVRNSSFIHALASTGESIGSVCWAVFNANLNRSDITPPIQTMLVRRAAKTKIAAHIGADPQKLEIVRRKNECGILGPPVVLVNGKESSIEISLSHDGVYLAYAFLLTGY